MYLQITGSSLRLHDEAAETPWWANGGKHAWTLLTGSTPKPVAVVAEDIARSFLETAKRIDGWSDVPRELADWNPEIDPIPSFVLNDLWEQAGSADRVKTLAALRGFGRLAAHQLAEQCDVRSTTFSHAVQIKSSHFVPAETWSAHWLTHPEFARAVDDFLDRERDHIDQYIDVVNNHTPYRQDSD